MRGKDNEAIVAMIILILFVFSAKGISGVLVFIKYIGTIMWVELGWVNQVSISLTGDTVLVLLFSTEITLGIVAIILEFFNISKGTLGKWIGNGAFWLVGIPVSFILNIVGRMIFL